MVFQVSPITAWRAGIAIAILFQSERATLSESVDCLRRGKRCYLIPQFVVAVAPRPYFHHSALSIAGRRGLE